MSEIIGFTLGIIIFLALIVFSVVKFISSPIIYILITLALIAIVTYFINIYLEKKNSRIYIKEFNDFLKEYQLSLQKKHVETKNKVIIEIITEIHSGLLLGENFVWVNNKHLCFYPSYPTLDNYLLYSNLKVVKIPLTDLSYTKTGKLENQEFKIIDGNETVVVNNSLNNDTRRTVIGYNDQKIILDYYAYDIIDKIVNNS